MIRNSLCSLENENLITSTATTTTTTTSLNSSIDINIGINSGINSDIDSNVFQQLHQEIDAASAVNRAKYQHQHQHHQIKHHQKHQLHHQLHQKQKHHQVQKQKQIQKQKLVNFKSNLTLPPSLQIPDKLFFTQNNTNTNTKEPRSSRISLSLPASPTTKKRNFSPEALLVLSSTNNGEGDVKKGRGGMIPYCRRSKTWSSSSSILTTPPPPAVSLFSSNHNNNNNNNTNNKNPTPPNWFLSAAQSQQSSSSSLLSSSPSTTTTTRMSSGSPTTRRILSAASAKLAATVNFGTTASTTTTTTTPPIISNSTSNMNMNTNMPPAAAVSLAPADFKFTNTIVDSIHDEVRSMTKGSRLVSSQSPLINANNSNSGCNNNYYNNNNSNNNNNNNIRLLTNALHCLRTYSILGTGTFSTVTGVTIMDAAPNSQQQTHSQQQQQHRRRYACKTIKAEVVGGDRERFVNAAAQLAYEALILGSLDHPNIIKIRGLNADGIMGFGKNNTNNNNNKKRNNNTTTATANNNNNNTNTGSTGFFLLTDVLQETLDQRIHRWRWSNCNNNNNTNANNNDNDDDDDETAILLEVLRRNIDKSNVCMQLASALEYVHSKNIVYRDLKPQNVGFDHTGALQLFDFGLCHELVVVGNNGNGNGNNNDNDYNDDNDDDDCGIMGKAVATGVIGTMRYMAPEVCLDQEYGRDCDIYSYAIVCWEIWTHRMPFETLTPELYQDWVCRRGFRPDQDNNNNNNTSSSSQQGVQDNNNINNNSIPREISVLLSQAWKHDPSSRIRWPKIQNQLSLFKQLQELRLEEREFVIADGDDDDDDDENLLLPFPQHQNDQDQDHTNAGPYYHHLEDHCPCT